MASDNLVPAAHLGSQEDYVVCIVGGRPETFAADDAMLRHESSTGLQQRAVERVSAWPEQASTIPAHGDPASFFFVQMYTSVPCDIGPATNVTLLGDAIHAMTPTLGRGANVAMRDAASLGRYVTAAGDGNGGIAKALNAYEREMTKYGFDVVRKAATMGRRLVGQNALPE